MAEQTGNVASLTFRNPSRSSNPGSWQVGVVTFATILWSVLMLWLCWSYGTIDHDYQAYIAQWQLVVDGDNPWSTDNRYGPLHNVFAFLLPLGPLAPKFFMVGALLIANAALILSLIRERGLAGIQLVYFLAIPTNLLVIAVGGWRGLNDSVVAALLVFAVLCRHRRQGADAALVHPCERSIVLFSRTRPLGRNLGTGAISGHLGGLRPPAQNTVNSGHPR
jgi:hypothetical protein